MIKRILLNVSKFFMSLMIVLNLGVARASLLEDLPVDKLLGDMSGKTYHLNQLFAYVPSVIGHLEKDQSTLETHSIQLDWLAVRLTHLMRWRLGPGDARAAVQVRFEDNEWFSVVRFFRYYNQLDDNTTISPTRRQLLRFLMLNLGAFAYDQDYGIMAERLFNRHESLDLTTFAGAIITPGQMCRAGIKETFKDLGWNLYQSHVFWVVASCSLIYGISQLDGN
jgi:hypothetical protein